MITFLIGFWVGASAAIGWILFKEALKKDPIIPVGTHLDGQVYTEQGILYYRE